MSKVISYKFLHCGSPNELEAKAQELVAQGYEPVGAPFVLKVDMAYNFYQAMIQKQ